MTWARAYFTVYSWMLDEASRHMIQIFCGFRIWEFASSQVRASLAADPRFVKGYLVALIALTPECWDCLPCVSLGFPSENVRPQARPRPKANVVHVVETGINSLAEAKTWIPGTASQQPSCRSRRAWASATNWGKWLWVKTNGTILG